MARPKKTGDRSTGKVPVGSPDNLHKRIESEQISSHIDAFEKSGGRVEKLGVTRVLQKVSPDPRTATPAPAKTPAAPRARPAKTPAK